MKKLLLSALSLLLCAALSAPVHAVIYGSDDRVEYYQADTAWQTASEAVVALLWDWNIDMSNPDEVLFYSGTFGDYQNLCPDERFYDQPTAGFCSGTLIDDDLILTAGHCISEWNCPDARFVFNYHMVGADTLETITTDDVFGCEEIVAREVKWNNDFAVVRLDRVAAPAFSPAPVQWGGLFEYGPFGSGVIVIGHPYGIPLKVAGNAVATGGNEDFFVLNSDTYAGNSGSSVFNPVGEVVGILVRGVEDWDYDSDGHCYRSRICDELLGCDPSLGEPFPTYVRTGSFADYVPRVPLCGDGLCEPPEDEFLCPEDCPQDSDYDASPDVIDNCPWVPNPTQDNFDGDDRGDACDCDEDDAGCWARPCIVPNLSLTHDQPTGWTVLTWDPPLEPGATSVVYDTLRSEFPMDFHVAACVESDDGLDLLSEDGELLPEGMVYYYLVRAQNNCPDGEGPLGGDWRGKPRAGRSCPF